MNQRHLVPCASAIGLSIGMDPLRSVRDEPDAEAGAQVAFLFVPNARDLGT